MPIMCWLYLTGCHRHLGCCVGDQGVYISGDRGPNQYKPPVKLTLEAWRCKSSEADCRQMLSNCMAPPCRFHRLWQKDAILSLAFDLAMYQGDPVPNGFRSAEPQRYKHRLCRRCAVCVVMREQSIKAASYGCGLILFEIKPTELPRPRGLRHGA